MTAAIQRWLPVVQRLIADCVSYLSICVLSAKLGEPGPRGDRWSWGTGAEKGSAVCRVTGRAERRVEDSLGLWDEILFRYPFGRFN